MTTTESQTAPTPLSPCRHCKNFSADGLDRHCTRCRIECACTGLTDGLTTLLENFLDNRRAPHEFGQPRPAYYVDKPNFDGDPAPYMARIATAHMQFAAAASQLVQLAMPSELRAKAEPAYEPHYFDPEEFDGIHAAIDWGYAAASSTGPIDCRRVIRSYLMDMVRSGEVLLPGDSIDPDNLPPGPPGSPVQRLTQEGLRELNEMPPED